MIGSLVDGEYALGMCLSNLVLARITEVILKGGMLIDTSGHRILLNDNHDERRVE